MEPQATATNIIEPIPAAWPGAFGLYEYSKQAILTNWGTILWVLLVAFVISLVISGLGGQDVHSGQYMISEILSILVGAYASSVTAIVLLKSAKREKIGFGDALSKATHYYWAMLAATLLMSILLGASMLLLIIPFFFVVPRLTLTPYFLIDNDLGPIEALKASWNETKGHSGKVWGIVGATLVFALLMLTIIGIPFALYFIFMYTAATPLLYYWIRANKPAVSNATVPVTPVAPMQQA